MVDARISKTAEILVNHSARIKKGEKAIINCSIESRELALEIYRLCLKKGAFPSIKCSIPGQAYTYYTNADEFQLKNFPESDFYEMKHTNAVFSLNAPSNTKELSTIEPSKIALRRKTLKSIQEWRVEKTKWIIFDFPTAALAQDAEMSLSEFEDFVYDAVLIDWKKQQKTDEKIKHILDKGKIVRIVGKDTDISMSIKGRIAINHAGECNMPDGEVFTAPVEDSVEGLISYSFPVIYGGREVEGVKLEFKKGKVVKASAAKNEDFLKKMIAMDNGSSRVGELGIGTNYKINKFMKQILFDEKIGGTVHLALGNSYKECGGKNKSALHWDMIKDLRADGKLFVDDKLIQKNGKFLI